MNSTVFIDHEKFTEILLKAKKNNGHVIIESPAYRPIEIYIDPVLAVSELDRLCWRGTS